jgi:CRISPR-associated exonuclease Cas4
MVIWFAVMLENCACSVARASPTCPELMILGVFTRYNPRKYNLACLPRLLQGIPVPAHPQHFTISDLVRVHTCPVRYYYERHDPFLESDRYVVCKQLSYHLGDPLDAEVIWAETLVVRPKIGASLREYLDTCITACNKSTWQPAEETDVHVHSDKQGIVGMIDRILPDGSFSIVRAAGALPIGTYAADRLRVAAIALCLGEMTGEEVKGGHIEYIPDGVSRFHTVQSRDLRQLITTLYKIRFMREGELPKHPLNAPCIRCKYMEKCESTRGHRLSELI